MSVVEDVTQLLAAAPHRAFSPAEVHQAVAGNIETTRAALKRLCARHVLVHVGHGQYRYARAPAGVQCSCHRCAA